MFLKKLFGFNKDYRYYLEEGDRYLHEERYADARDAFAEAMQKITESDEEDVSVGSLLREKFAETGNRLGLLNLSEAEHALNIGDHKKAEDQAPLRNASLHPADRRAAQASRCPGMSGSGDVLWGFAGEQEAILADGPGRLCEHAVHPDGCVRRARFAGGNAEHRYWSGAEENAVRSNCASPAL